MRGDGGPPKIPQVNPFILFFSPKHVFIYRFYLIVAVVVVVVVVVVIIEKQVTQRLR